MKRTNKAFLSKKMFKVKSLGEYVIVNGTKVIYQRKDKVIDVYISGSNLIEIKTIRDLKWWIRNLQKMLKEVE